MAISEKGKRRITVEGRRYLWWVFDEYDQGWFDGPQVNVATPEQDLFIRYGLQQQDERRCAWVRYRQDEPVQKLCPQFEQEEGILTPKDIRSLILWALSTDEDANHK